MIVIIMNLLFPVSHCYGEGNIRTNADTVGDKIFVIKIHPNLPKYFFSIVEQSNNSIDITISKDTGSAVVQEFIVEMDEQCLSGEDYFKTEDINFDGYLDIKIPNSCWHKGKSYNYWLFDKGTGKFLFNKDLQYIDNPTLNPMTKEITSSLSSGGEYTIFTYQFYGNNLVLTREEDQTWIADKNYFLRIIKERKKGKLREVKREIINEH